MEIKTISSLMPQISKHETQSLQLISQQNSVAQVHNRYGDAGGFLTLFNPSKQAIYCRRLIKCFTGSAPSLNLLASAYGMATAESWVECQIKDLSEFSGCKEKLSVVQIEQISQTIHLHFGELKVTELMVFFQRFKAGQYGKFYGAVDGLAITEALQMFMRERMDMLKKIQRDKEKEIAQERERQRESRRDDLIPMEEWSEIGWLFRM